MATITQVKAVKRPLDLTRHLRVLSVFRSFDGEQNAVGGMGWPTVFVRLSGCVGIYCKYCDTKYSWDPRRGRDVVPETLMRFVKEAQSTEGMFQSDKVTITGGEPLQQCGPALFAFIELLLEDERVITVETAGTEDVSWLVNAGVSVVADVKLPSAESTKAPHYSSLVTLGPYHAIKMVAADDRDLESAIDVVRFLRDRGCGARIAVGPVNGGSSMTLQKIATWINSNRILVENGVGVNYQLHKLMFPEEFRDEERTPGGKDFCAEKNIERKDV